MTAYGTLEVVSLDVDGLNWSAFQITNPSAMLQLGIC